MVPPDQKLHMVRIAASTIQIHATGFSQTGVFSKTPGRATTTLPITSRTATRPKHQDATRAMLFEIVASLFIVAVWLLIAAWAVSCAM